MAVSIWKLGNGAQKKIVNTEIKKSKNTISIVIKDKRNHSLHMWTHSCVKIYRDGGNWEI